MFIALNSEKQKVVIMKAKDDKKYFCPICDEELCIKRGDIKAHHYAHKKNSKCQDKWHYDMTEWHYNWQSQFPIENQEVVFELNGEKHRADVFIKDTVFEFQHSDISKKEFQERNIFYKTLGYSIIWVFDVREDYNNDTLYQLYDNNYIWRHSRTNFYEYENDEKIKIYLQCSENTWYIDKNYKEYDDFYDYSGDLLNVIKDSNSKGLQYFNVIKKIDDIDLLKEYLNIKKNEIPLDNVNIKYKIRDISDYLFLENHDCYITNYYGYCPMTKNNRNRNECHCCQYYDMKKNTCDNRFKKLLTHKIDKINSIERDREGRIVKINATLEIEYSKLPNNIDTLIYLWKKYNVKTTAVVLNVESGFYWKISNLINQLEKYKRCYGYYKRKDNHNYSKQTSEIFYWKYPIWVMIWFN